MNPIFSTTWSFELRFCREDDWMVFLYPLSPLFQFFDVMFPSLSYRIGSFQPCNIDVCHCRISLVLTIVFKKNNYYRTHLHLCLIMEGTLHMYIYIIRDRWGLVEAMCISYTHCIWVISNCFVEKEVLVLSYKLNQDKMMFMIIFIATN